MRDVRGCISLIVPSLAGYEELNRKCIESYVEMAGEKIEVVLIEEPGTFAENVNKGMKRASGSIVVIVNNDSIGLPEWDVWVREGVATKVGIVSLTPRADCGWGFAASRELIERVGMMDESLINSYDDYDYFIRAATYGYGRLLAKKAFAIHTGGVTLAGNWGEHREQRPERIRQCMANREYMMRKWPGLQIDAVPTSYWAYHGVDVINEWKKTCGNIAS